ncbi:MAG TPA: TonB-dependent receptor [Chitinophagaceae bacterium]|nr:TonB-dependent receptor [Chitinophagaceae bacterium]
MAKSLIVAIVSLFGCYILSAQTGKISGKVLNQKNEAIPGVSVKIVGAPGGVTTDVEGRYTLTLSVEKKYELEFSAVGYAAKAISDIDLSAGQVTELNIMLEVSNKDLGTVTVTATRSTARKETVNALIQFQRNTNTVASVISAEAIRRSPDKNTGEVLKRIPGTSIQEGKYLVVRGLSDRYNTAMLNGIQLSSTEPDRKTFSFDIFPSSMIDNIVINKAFVPEYPGEWGGGMVQVNTKDIPSSNFFTIQVGTGFNSRTIGKDFHNYEGGMYDWLGIDDGARALPDGFLNKTQFSNASNTQKTALGKQIATQWAVNKVAAPINASFQLSGGFNTKLFKKDFGAILGLAYNRSHRNLEFDNSFYSFDNSRSSLLFDYNSHKYSSDVLAGALANFALKLNNNHKITLKNILNVNSSDYTTLRTGLDFEQNSAIGENIRARELAFKSNIFFNTQLAGEHNIRALSSKINWYGSFNILDAYIPQQRRVQYNQSRETPNAPYLLLLSESRSQKTGSVFYSTLSDYIYNTGGDITTNFNLFNNKQTVKLGYLFQVKDRLFNSRPFSIYLTDGTSPLRMLPEEQVFAPENFDANDPQKFKFDEIIGKQFRYMANSILNAGYVQLDNNFTDWLRVVWGVRYEHFDQLVGSPRKSDKRHAHSKVGDFLPAVNAVIKLGSKTNLRVIGSQTIVRPEFRELTNFAFYDFELGAAVIGLSSLQRTKISNLDIRYELYPRAGEMFTLGVFYKYFKNPIELYFNQSGVATNTFNYLNVDKATGYGLEFEMRKKLDFVEALKNFTFQANVSYIRNKVEDPGVKVDRPMQGQSPYLFNAALQYDLEKIGLNTTILFNQIGRRILYVGNDQVPEIWENPRPLLDLQFAKKIKKRGEVRLNISDIINKTAFFYHDVDRNDRFKNGGIDKIAISRNYGTNFSISFGYTFK